MGSILSKSTSSSSSSSSTEAPSTTTTLPTPTSTSVAVQKLTGDQHDECCYLLSQCEMFQKFSPSQLSTLADHMTLLKVRNNETFLKQGQPCDAFYLMRSSSQRRLTNDNNNDNATPPEPTTTSSSSSSMIRRDYVDPISGKSHQVQFEIQAQSINSMRVLSGDPLHNSVTCTSSSGGGCQFYVMDRSIFLELLQKQPQLSIAMSAALSEQVRLAHKKYRTPILEQKSVQLSSEGLNIPSVILAAGLESYYRSALNAQINYVLTGVQAPLFPNMHIQVPTRISYIVGFKGLRQYIDKHFNNNNNDASATSDTAGTTSNNNNTNNNTLLRSIRLGGFAILPGVIMTPISSLLEASNAGHLNPEPLWQWRWLRGITARCGREVIFGLGLNQMSDYFEEYFAGNTIGTLRENPMLANAVGSLTAGVVSGYLSHVPHNLSTYKLLEPHRSYRDLYSMFVDRSVPQWMDHIIDREWKLSKHSTARTIARYSAATLFPRGLIVRTVQIVGSFVILNGTINYLQLIEHRKIERAKKQATDHPLSSPPTTLSSPYTPAKLLSRLTSPSSSSSTTTTTTTIAAPTSSSIPPSSKKLTEREANKELQ